MKFFNWKLHWAIDRMLYNKSKQCMRSDGKKGAWRQATWRYTTRGGKWARWGKTVSKEFERLCKKAYYCDSRQTSECYETK